MNRNGNNVKKKKKNIKYSEEQLKNRQRVAFRSFVLLCALVFINGVSSSIYAWGSPMIRMFVILQITGIYFMTTSIARNVYLINQDYTKKFSNTAFLVLSAFCAFSSVMGIYVEGMSYIFKDNRLADSAIAPIMFFFCICPPVISALKSYNYTRKH